MLSKRPIPEGKQCSHANCREVCHVKSYAKEKKPIKKTFKPKDKEQKERLEAWFQYHMKHSERICENCGASLAHYDDEAWRGSQHHLIEKSKVNGCPSVATNIFNHGVLGRWCCHPIWHTSNEKASQMPFFKEAKIRFKIFEAQIAEDERHKIPEMFTKPYDK